MQRIILLFTAIFFTMIATYAQWTSVSTGTTSMYESIYFFDANNGIASSTDDVIKTSNGGVNWTVVNTSGIRDIDFAGSSVGYAAGLTGSSLKKTSDGGTTWSSLTPLGSNVLWGVSVVDASTAYVCGASGAVWETINGGISFSAVNISTTNTIIDLQFLNANEGCALQLNGNVWKTTDGGSNWTITYATVGIYFSSVFFVDAYTGFAVGSNGTIIKTVNSGSSWTTLTTGSLSYLQYVDFYNTLNGIAVGTGGTVLHTKDGGSTWSLDNTGISASASLYSCTLLSPTTAIVAGTNGTMYKTTSLIGDVGQFSLNSDFTVFPNPATNMLVIDISDNHQSTFNVTIFNMHGQLLNEQVILQARTEIDISSLAKGVYYIRVEDKDRMGIKKFTKE